jgi:hypothetical protein
MKIFSSETNEPIEIVYFQYGIQWLTQPTNMADSDINRT